MASDVSLLYPVRSDFERSFERSDPQLFNYFCLHGKQVFAALQRRRFRVFTQGWRPKRDVAVEFRVSGDRYIVVDTSVFDVMINTFIFTVRELCVAEFDLFGK